MWLACSGISRQRVGQLVATDPTFPRSGGWRHGGRLWHRAGIEVWAAEFRPGRVEPNPMARVILRLVQHARLESRRLGWSLVDSPFFWLGFWDVAEDRRVADVLETLGVTREDVARTLKRRFVTRGTPLDPTMSPRVQQELEAALRRAREHGRSEPRELDVAITLVEQEIRWIANARPQSETNWFGGRQADAVLMALEERGLDPVELRGRLEWVEASPRSIETFDRRPLEPMRRQRPHERARPPWLPELARNPLGHDPWELGGFGSVSFMTPDDRMYKVDGYHVVLPHRRRRLSGAHARWAAGRLPVAGRSAGQGEGPRLRGAAHAADPVANWPDYEGSSRKRP